MHNFRYQHYRSLTQDKIPTPDDLNEGELFVNIHPASRSLWTKDGLGNVVKIVGEGGLSLQLPQGSPPNIYLIWDQDNQTWVADELHYVNSGYPQLTTIQLALDYLLYSPISGTFSISNFSDYEVGATVNGPFTASWSFTRPLFSGTISSSGTSGDITVTGVDSPSVSLNAIALGGSEAGSYNYTLQLNPIVSGVSATGTGSVTYTLNLVEDPTQVPNGQSSSPLNISRSLRFRLKMFYFYSTNADYLSPGTRTYADISSQDKFTDAGFRNSAIGYSSNIPDPSVESYLYVLVPVEYNGTPRFFVGGLETTFIAQGSPSGYDLELQTGATVKYIAYRTNFQQNSGFTLDIVS